ncbi:FAD-binding protein [Paraherbaspirillum soli]|uniref:FAD-binding protein n=1 Tax=Paraherbaspirillum soli TaxID=631222 RepID=A0ABW0MH68_9BURK
MASFVEVNQQDPRYETLKKGFNLRWPPQGDPGASLIYVCKTAEEVALAANDALGRGYRLTVRSGGHCYEGFVSNTLPEPGKKQLAIIDLGPMSGLEYDEKGLSHPNPEKVVYKFRIAAGSQNWNSYVDLYKQTGKALPGGSCYSVGVGGHISGGGYGLSSRMQGLTVDWLSGVDILVPAPDGKSVVQKHVNRKSTNNDRLLFLSCCGGGGGNLGIITNYYFSELPDAPREAYWLVLEFPWAEWDRVGKERFGNFLQAYWQWFKTHDAEWDSPNPTKANGGLFVLGKFQHRSSGSVALAMQYTGLDGTLNDTNSQPLVDFVKTMTDAAGFKPLVGNSFIAPNIPAMNNPRGGQKADDALKDALRLDWLPLTQLINGSGANQRGKYKSSYQIGNFTDTEIDALWNNLNNDDPVLTQSLVQIDSYGGRMNDPNPAYNIENSVYQRRSLLKSQYQTYWAVSAGQTPGEAAEIERKHIAWIRKIFKDVHKNQGGKPYEIEPNPRYEGCYISYPDIDMKYTDDDHKTVDPQWLRLYYGNKVDDLVKAKKAFDPHNIFHHEMSLPTSNPEK